MKKILTSIAIIVFVSFVFNSCTKDCTQTTIVNNTTSRTIQGLWVGTWSYNAQPSWGKLYFSYSIKPDGTLVNDGITITPVHWVSFGNWTLSGDTLGCAYNVVYPTQNNNVQQTSKAYFDSTNGTLTGTWKTLVPDTATGTFFLKKVN
jgi:hypothetical protein